MKNYLSNVEDSSYVRWEVRLIVKIRSITKLPYIKCLEILRNKLPRLDKEELVQHDYAKLSKYLIKTLKAENMEDIKDIYYSKRKKSKTFSSLINSYGMIFSLFLAVTFFSNNAEAKRLQHERVYQSKYCADQRGVQEYILEDYTRVDCLTDKYAIELDFADKWYEGVTQALYYAQQTGFYAKLALIIEREDDIEYYKRAVFLARHYNLPIEIDVITPEKKNEQTN